MRLFEMMTENSVDIRGRTPALDFSYSFKFDSVPFFGALRVSKPRNSFSKPLLEVNALRAVGPNISLTFGRYIRVQFQACFEESSTFECHFDEDPVSKIVFPEAHPPPPPFENPGSAPA